MLDRALRPLIDPPLAALGRVLAVAGIHANAVTLAAAAVSVTAVAAIATAHFLAGLMLIALSRLLDGLDGALARCRAATDFGGYLDSVCDYVFYAGVPFGFALAAPGRNALAAAALLAGFLLTCASFLAFAAIAAKRGITGAERGPKSFFYSGGLVEGTETILFFAAMCLWPARFPLLAGVLCLACVATAAQRSAAAWRTFG